MSRTPEDLKRLNAELVEALEASHTYATDALQSAFRARLPGLNKSNAATLAFLAIVVMAGRLGLQPWELDKLRAYKEGN